MKIWDVQLVKGCSKRFLIMVCRGLKKASLAETGLLHRSFSYVPVCGLFGLACTGVNLQGLNVACWKDVCI